jgi:hypothetical protein
LAECESCSAREGEQVPVRLPHCQIKPAGSGSGWIDDFLFPIAEHPPHLSDVVTETPQQFNVIRSKGAENRFHPIAELRRPLLKEWAPNRSRPIQPVVRLQMTVREFEEINHDIRGPEFVDLKTGSRLVTSRVNVRQWMREYLAERFIIQIQAKVLGASLADFVQVVIIQAALGTENIDVRIRKRAWLVPLQVSEYGHVLFKLAGVGIAVA